jgi:para-aminobenzoate synthetase/4-amino-4-deoxychorismate lyase
LSISSVFIVSPLSLRSSQAVTADGPLSTAHLPRPDPARGVFETLLVVDGRPVELNAHLDRLALSVRELFGAPTVARVVGPARVLAETRARETTADGASPTLARLRLTVAPDGHGKLDLSAATAHVDGASVFPGPDGGPALAPITVAGGLGDHKWADRRLLGQATEQLGGALPLIVDADGSVLEAERANLFLASNGTLATPPTDGRILPGVGRARVLEIARELELEVDERPVAVADLHEADEVFLTGSVRGVEPVGAVAGTARSAGGPLTTRIATALGQRWLSAANDG